MRALWVGVGVFAVLFAFFWVVPNRSRFASSATEFTLRRFCSRAS